MIVEQVVKKSSSGSTKWIDNIYFDVENAKAYAAAILLKHYYLQQDEDYIKSFAGRMEMINFSRTYLTHVKQATGELCCAYCNKPNLIIELDGMKVPNNIKATIDHIVPKSKGGPLFDYANLCVACGKCNSKKGSMSVEAFKASRKL